MKKTRDWRRASRRRLAAMFLFLQNVQEENRENYRATVAEVLVQKDGETAAILRPEKRRYFARPDNAMTEAGIAAMPFGDLYVALGEPLGDGAWSGRLQIKPMVRLVWGGALLMAAGGALSIFARRRRPKVVVENGGRGR